MPKLDLKISRFLRRVKVGANSCGIDAFLGTYLEEMLTYGTAVGEIVMKNGEPYALYNTDLRDVEIREDKELNAIVCTRVGGELKPCRQRELIMVTALNPEPGKVTGVSILRGLPFVCDVLMKIYRTTGTNWDRLGNVRFAVSLAQDGGYAPERAKTVANEWQKAMRKDSVSDFISVGEVNIKAIGSDVQILDSEVPVRQMLEQIVAKLGIPPFLLGFSWSSTERMSSQQADILTSELEAYRRLLEPAIIRIVDVFLMSEGIKRPDYEIEWDDITMQDELDHQKALLLAAQRKAIEGN
ncbi:MAG: serine/threonine protein phosphatase [Clostridia bacterium]|nr:serine/threonine protein phosphatase [Clostridia bacterium]